MSYNGLHILYAKSKLSYTKIICNTFSSMSNRAATKVFQGVEEQIATGQLKDGTKLDEATLAENFRYLTLCEKRCSNSSGQASLPKFQSVDAL